MRYVITPRINNLRSKAEVLISVLERAQATELLQAQELLKLFCKVLDLEQACIMLKAKELSRELILVLEQAKIHAKTLVQNLTQAKDQMQATEPELDHELTKTEDKEYAAVLSKSLKQANELVKAKRLAEELVEHLEDVRWSEWVHEAAKQRRS
ncbi:hypothetical protein [Acaryochloris marina]|uniref:hypothetical protein n=1 Tax=Acaryochloris marina TaxID=155978 RepID=UPI001BB0923B|nr:hypothetical protein [Acaryochloris marina]QUY45451.1 hypothetical protein I1H34_27115 [Acaryochloris marina S15]